MSPMTNSRLQPLVWGWWRQGLNTRQISERLRISEAEADRLLSRELDARYAARKGAG